MIVSRRDKSGIHRKRRTDCDRKTVVLTSWCLVSRALLDWVAGAGLSGAKEAPGFRAGALQPRPPINPTLTEHCLSL